MEGIPSLEDKLIEVKKLAKRRKEIATFIYSTKTGGLELWVGNHTKINVKSDEEELAKFIGDYFEKELEKVDERLNELLK